MNGASAGGYKNYLGHSKHVKHNVYVHPEWRAGSFGGNTGMCVQDVGNPTLAMWCEKVLFLAPFSDEIDFCQDRLGTNIRKR